LNYLFEGLVTGDKYGSAVGIVALILVVGGAFGVIMRTGAVEAGIYAFMRRSKGVERYTLPVLFLLFSLGGATFGMSEECIPFAMVMVPFVIAMGYVHRIVTVTLLRAVETPPPITPSGSRHCARDRRSADPVRRGPPHRISSSSRGGADIDVYAEKSKEDPHFRI
jgi:hypothetical protein